MKPESHRGQDLARIYPVRHENGIKADDPLYSFHKRADKRAKALSDREMDRLLYGG